MCISYNATLRLTEDVSKLHKVPIEEWIRNGLLLKFWGDNLDTLKRVRDLRSDNIGEMLHMFSMIVGQSRTPALELSFTGQVGQLKDASPASFKPRVADVAAVKDNLVILVARTLTEYIPSLAPFSKVVPN